MVAVTAVPATVKEVVAGTAAVPNARMATRAVPTVAAGAVKATRITAVTVAIATEAAAMTVRNPDPVKRISQTVNSAES